MTHSASGVLVTVNGQSVDLLGTAHILFGVESLIVTS